MLLLLRRHFKYYHVGGEILLKQLYGSVPSYITHTSDTTTQTLWHDFTILSSWKNPKSLQKFQFKKTPNEQYEHSASLDQRSGKKSNKHKLPVKTPLEGQ